ncbi:MAG: hypothetical protein JXQ91_03405 [Vannielia sp.]|uniref:hypothetical protein n=1 Tax=Vannielia sp. TaxID=2813045 RepID=UPI003B8D1EEF
MHRVVGVFLAFAMALCAGRAALSQEAEADGALAVLLDLSLDAPEGVLAELVIAWPGTRRIASGADPGDGADPLYWSAMFQTPGAADTPPHGLTLSCTRYGHRTHRALMSARRAGLRPWPGGADVRLFCEGYGVYWGRELGAELVHGAEAMVETWAEERDPSFPGLRRYRGGDTAPRGGRMVKGFGLETSPAGGKLPGVVVSLEVEIYGFGLE